MSSRVPKNIISTRFSPIFAGCDGAFDVSAGSRDVHPVWHRHLTDFEHLHEEPGHLKTQQER